MLVYYIDQAANDFFVPHSLEAVQKSAGVVDREEARALLLLQLDALGEPLLPFRELSPSDRPLGRQLGEGVRLAAGRLDKKVKAAAKAAGRTKGAVTKFKEVATAKTLAEQPDVDLAILAECIAAARSPPRNKRPVPAPEPAPQPERKPDKRSATRVVNRAAWLRREYNNTKYTCAETTASRATSATASIARVTSSNTQCSAAMCTVLWLRGRLLPGATCVCGDARLQRVPSASVSTTPTRGLTRKDGVL